MTELGYLYRQIRLDKNEVFYIGIGGFDKTEKEGSYKRAFNKRKRSEYWNNIVNKTDYVVEIMLDNLTFEECKIKETEFIKLYGRRDLGLGTLVNMTNGGDGIVGLHHTEETRSKMSKSHKGIPLSEEHKKNSAESRKGIPLSEETKKKIGNSNKGKIRSEETINKLSESHKKKNISEEDLLKKKEKIKESSKKWREKNKDKTKEQNKKWKQENKEKIKDYNEKNKDKRKEYMIEYNKEYYQQNIEREKERSRKGRQ